MGGGSMTGFLSPSPVTAMGGSTSPFSPGPMPAGSSMPAFNSPYAPTGASSTLAGLSPGQVGKPGYAGQSETARGFQQAGFSGGVGTALAEFLSTGAGYNPAVAQAMIAALQPQFAQSQANMMEQFGSMGLGMGSPAALGMASLGAQENLDVGTILSQLYEQSVQNYMDVLIAGKGEPKQQGGGILGALGSLLGGAGSGAGSALASAFFL